MKKNQEKLKLFGLQALGFVLNFLLAFMLLFAAASVFYKFELISVEICLWLPAAVSIAWAVAWLVHHIITVKSNKITRINYFFIKHTAGFYITYVVVVILLFSIKSEIVWDYEKAKAVLAIAWTMFGLVITIFIVWNVLIIEYLSKRKPHFDKAMTKLNRIEYILKKGSYQEKSAMFFSSPVILSITLLILLFATQNTYIQSNEVTLFNQSLIIAAFYFCGSSLSMLFWDILVPYRDEKNKLTKDAYMTKEDVDFHNETSDQITKTLLIIDQLDQLDSIDEEQKDVIKRELLAKLLTPTKEVEVLPAKGDDTNTQQ